MYATSAIPAHNYQRPTWGKPNTGYEGRRRMAEDRAGYTTGSPADAADSQQAEPTENISAFPQRTWTQVSNAFMQVAFSEFGLGATRTFLYILRYTEGFHQDSVSLSIDELCHGKRFGEKRLDDGTKLARTTVLDGLKELTAKHIITTTSTGRGRGIVSVYHILPPTEWRLCIGGNSLPIGTPADDADIGSDTLPINVNIGSNYLPIPPIIGSKRLPPLKKERKKEQKKEKASAVVSEVAASDLSVAATRDAALFVSPSPTEPTPAPSKPSAPPQNKVAPRRTLADDSQAVLLAAALRDAILTHKPDARDAKAALQPAKLQQWAIPMDLLLRVDQRDYDRTLAIIRFATTDDFWRANILSPGKFREKWDSLDAQARRQTKHPQPAQASTTPTPHYGQAHGLPTSWSTPTSSLPPVMPGARLARNTNDGR